MASKPSSSKLPIKRSAAASASAPDVSDLIKRIRAIASEIPDFKQLATVKVRRLTANAHLHDGFLNAVGNAIDSSPSLQTAVGSTTPDQIRQNVDFATAYGAVAEELEGLARGIRNTIAAKRSEIANAALQAYAIAGRMAKLDEHARLIPHVTEMKKTLGRGRGSRQPKTEPPPKP